MYNCVAKINFSHLSKLSHSFSMLHHPPLNEKLVSRAIRRKFDIKFYLSRNFNNLHNFFLVSTLFDINQFIGRSFTSQIRQKII